MKLSEIGVDGLTTKSNELKEAKQIGGEAMDDSTRDDDKLAAMNNFGNGISDEHFTNSLTFINNHH